VRKATGAEEISRWREAASSAAVLMLTLLVAYAIVWAEKGRPLPLREHLVRIDGTVEKMRVQRGDDCTYLSIRIHTGSGRVRAENSMLCHQLARLKPLPPGTAVSVLAEPTPDGHQVWELRSGDRVLIAYEQMRAGRERQQRALPWVGALIAALCLPLAAVIVAWLWKELSRLMR